MRIAFHDDGVLDYTPQTPFDGPLGGAETTAAYLSAALADRGHEVALINRASTRGRVRGVEVLGAQAARPKVINQYDVLISLTRPMGAEMRGAGVRIPMVLWQHQAAKTERVRAFGQEEERRAWSAIVFVSEHQRRGYRRRLGVDGHVMRNAASPSVLAREPSDLCFLDRGEDPVLIYASGPSHGLELLLLSFPAIRERLPGAVLRICSDSGLYQHAGETDPYTAYYALARALGGVEFVGAVSQARLGQHYSNADILAYPTSFVETSCIVAIEAAASGCLFIGTDRGALRETLDGFGVFLPYQDSRPHLTRAYAELFVETIRAARADPALFKRRRAEQIAAFRATHTWEQRAAQWEGWLEQGLRSGWPDTTAQPQTPD